MNVHSSHNQSLHRDVLIKFKCLSVVRKDPWVLPEFVSFLVFFRDGSSGFFLHSRQLRVHQETKPARGQMINLSLLFFLERKRLGSEVSVSVLVGISLKDSDNLNHVEILLTIRRSVHGCEILIPIVELFV